MEMLVLLLVRPENDLRNSYRRLLLHPNVFRKNLFSLCKVRQLGLG